MRPLLKVSFLFAFLSVIACSCTFKENLYTPNEADNYFFKIAKEEFKYQPALVATGKTLWIYVPLKTEIFRMKAKEEGPAAKTKKISVESLEGKFEDRVFIFDYDIAPAVKPADNKGLANDYTETFNETYRNILTAISRAYLNSSAPPDFIIVVFADTHNGVEVIDTLCVEDLKKYQSGALPQEEYALRILTDSKGDPKIINDTTGTSLDPQEMTWGDFLARQIAKRIQFKFEQSDFTPDEDITKEILTLTRETLHSYQFLDFAAVRLHDLKKDTRQEFSWTQVFGITK